MHNSLKFDNRKSEGLVKAYIKELNDILMRNFVEVKEHVGTISSNAKALRFSNSLTKCAPPYICR